jgi:hypothetical protein
MSMHINLSPEMEGFIKNQVSSGAYGNAIIAAKLAKLARLDFFQQVGVPVQYFK